MYYQILADLNRHLAVREGGEGWYLVQKGRQTKRFNLVLHRCGNK